MVNPKKGTPRYYEKLEKNRENYERKTEPAFKSRPRVAKAIKKAVAETSAKHRDLEDKLRARSNRHMTNANKQNKSAALLERKAAKFEKKADDLEEELVFFVSP